MRFLHISILALLFCSLNIGVAQTNTVAIGNWNTGSTWSTGTVPGNDSTTNVNHPLTLDRNLSPSGIYTINAPVIDPDGGTNYNLNVSGTLDVRANMKAGGTLQVDGQVTIRSGDTLTIGYSGSTANSAVGAFANITIEADGVLIVNGDLATEAFGVIACDGEIIVNGNFEANAFSGVTGSGTITTTGTMTTSWLGGSVFGSGADCNTGPCSGSSGCGVSTANNIVPASTIVCSGDSPGQLTGTNHGGGATYSWERSTGSSSSGFSTIGGATGRNYTPGALGTTTWYRRTVSLGGGACVSVSPVVQITVNTGSWNGATSTNWNTNSNWCSGSRPGAGTVVNLHSGPSNMPVVSTNAAVCNNLIVHSGATVTINANTLTINNNLIINPGGSVIINGGSLNVENNLIINPGGTLTINSPGTFSVKRNIVNNGKIAGTGTITLNGSISQNLSGASSFTNLALNNPAGCKTTSPITVTGVLTLTSGEFNSNGNLSIDLNTGAIAGIGSGTISGDIQVFKTANSARYHYLSSPLMTGMTASDWNDDIQIKTGSYSNLYYYNEAVSSPVETDGWTGISNLATALTPLTGYALFFEGPRTLDQTGPYTHGAIPASIVLSNTPSSDVNADGWNLIGNPYPSTLDWDAASGWTKTGLEDAIYFWDPINDRYASYVNGLGTNGGTRYIPSMQGFWVRVATSGGTGTLSLNNNARVTNTNPSIWKISIDSSILRLIVKHGNKTDETVIRFMEDALNSYDNRLDAHKLKNDGNTPSLYTVLGQDEYSINSLPESGDITIPLHLETKVAGQYTISAPDAGLFAGSYDIFLEDRLMNTEQSLRANEEYSFNSDPADTTGRFLIHFRQTNVASVYHTPTITKVTIYSSEHTINFDFQNTSALHANIGVYTIHGHQLTQLENVDISGGNYALHFPDQSGIYLVKVALEGELITQKIYLR